MQRELMHQELAGFAALVARRPGLNQPQQPHVGAKAVNARVRMAARRQQFRGGRG